MEKRIDRFCISCDKNLSSGLGGDSEDSFDYPPCGGTVWTSHGNYGSSEYDPMSGGEYLEAFICDQCLVSKASKVYRVKTEKVYKKEFEKFDEYRNRDLKEDKGQ